MTLTSVIYNIIVDITFVNIILAFNNVKKPKKKFLANIQIMLYSITFFRHHQMWVSCIE